MEGRYERRTEVCYACAAVQPEDGYKPEPGEIPYVWRNPKAPRKRRGKVGKARPA